VIADIEEPYLFAGSADLSCHRTLRGFILIEKGGDIDGRDFVKGSCFAPMAPAFNGAWPLPGVPDAEIGSS